MGSTRVNFSDNMKFIITYNEEQIARIKNRVSSIMEPYNVGDNVDLFIPSIRNREFELINKRVIVSLIDLIKPTVGELRELRSIFHSLEDVDSYSSEFISRMRGAPYIVDADILAIVLSPIPMRASSHELAIKMVNAIPGACSPVRLSSFSIKWIDAHGLDAYHELTEDGMISVALGEYVPSPHAPYTNGEGGGVGEEPCIFDGCYFNAPHFEITHEDDGW